MNEVEVYPERARFCFALNSAALLFFLWPLIEQVELPGLVRKGDGRRLSLSYNAIAFLLVMGLFAGMLLMLTLGQFLGRRSRVEETDADRSRLTGVKPPSSAL